MKNKRKHVEQVDKAEELAKRKLAKLAKVKKPDSPDVVNIKTKAQEVIDSRKNVNNLVDIIAKLDLGEKTEVLLAAIQGLKRVFVTLLEKGEVGKEMGDGEGSEDKLKSWMSERLQEASKKLAALLYHPKTSITSLVLATITALLKAAYSAGGDANTWGQVEKQVLHNFLLSMCSTKKDSKAALVRAQELLVFSDVKFYLLKQLKKTITTAVTNEKVNNFFIDNVIHVLEMVDMKSLTGGDLTSLLCRDQDTGESLFALEVAAARETFQQCWLAILKTKINLAQYKRVLILLQEKVIPFMPRPLLLTDFLLTSYSVGGAISLLALSSVYTLISQHNLEFPQFYTKLYQLFAPEVMHVKYRPRFFHLSSLFLSSTHLPEYLVAAFVKRLARLCLTAPAHCIPMALRFIHNLIHRHPGLVRLLDNPGGPGDSVETDPFDNSTSDPDKSRAIESSLWEVETLQRHCLPTVSSAAKELMEKGLREQELDISSMLEVDWVEAMEAEAKKKVFPNVPINWEEPDGLKPRKESFLEIFSFA